MKKEIIFQKDLEDYILQLSQTTGENFSVVVRNILREKMIEEQNKKSLATFEKTLTRIRFASSSAEKNSLIILEMLNSISKNFEIEYSNETSEVYKKSKKIISQKINNYKLKKQGELM